MNKWLLVGGVIAAAVVIIVVPGGIPLVAATAKKLRDKHRARAAEREEIRVASLQQRLREAPVC